MLNLYLADWGISLFFYKIQERSGSNILSLHEENLIQINKISEL